MPRSVAAEGPGTGGQTRRTYGRVTCPLSHLPSKITFLLATVFLLNSKPVKVGQALTCSIISSAQASARPLKYCSGHASKLQQPRLKTARSTKTGTLKPPAGPLESS